VVRTKKKKCLPSSLTVTQSNKLVEARYNLPLSEQRLVMTMIASIRLEDEDFKEYRISVIDFADFLGIDRNSAYRELDKVTTSLMGRYAKYRIMQSILFVSPSLALFISLRGE
jgi:hypothetical protein